MGRGLVTVVGLLLLAVYGGNSAAGGEVRTSIHCTRNEDCPGDRACRQGYCFNPCIEICGKNTLCFISLHQVTSCSCLPGHTGDPLKECTLVLETSAPEPKPVPPSVQARVAVPKLALSAPVTASAPVAAAAKYPKRDNTKKKFYIGKNRRVWTDAVGECYSRRMYLASINSLKEQVQLEEDVARAGIEGEDVWIGLIWARHIQKRAKVFWISTGKSGTFKGGLPFNHYHRCTRSYGSCYVSSAQNHWCETSCDERHFYACEYFED